MGGQTDVVRGEVCRPPGDPEDEPRVEQVDEDQELVDAVGSSGRDSTKRIGRDPDVKSRPEVHNKPETKNSEGGKVSIAFAQTRHENAVFGLNNYYLFIYCLL